LSPVTVTLKLHHTNHSLDSAVFSAFRG